MKICIGRKLRDIDNGGREIRQVEDRMIRVSEKPVYDTIRRNRQKMEEDGGVREQGAQRAENAGPVGGGGDAGGHAGKGWALGLARCGVVATARLRIPSCSCKSPSHDPSRALHPQAFREGRTSS